MRQSRRAILGQHFLVDARYRQRILEVVGIRDDDLVVEIGAGRGEMTGPLASKARRVIAVELDARLLPRLRATVGDDVRVEIVNADILRTNLAQLCRRHRAAKCLVFGNLPYYITSPIIHHLLEFRSSIRAMALLVQREVAERLTATPGTRAYGYLSVLAQVYSRPRLALAIPPGAFSPSPKVRSSLVLFDMQPRFPAWKRGAYDTFLSFVKSCFAQKRKSLVNNLAAIYSRDLVEKQLARSGLLPTIRAEQLSIEQMAELHRALEFSAGG